MSYKRIIELANKFADDSSYQNQELKNKLTYFQNEFSTKFNSIITEMDGDLASLKIMNFDKNIFKIFTKLWNNLLEFNNKLSGENKLNTINEIIDFVTSKQTMSMVDNLEFLINHFLEKNKIDTSGTAILSNINVQSLHKLLNLILESKDFIKNHPEFMLFEVDYVPEQLQNKVDKETALLNKKII